MEWFGRGGGSGAPLFPGRLETKSGPGAAASAASEPKAEACTGTLSQAKQLPSHTHNIIFQRPFIARLLILILIRNIDIFLESPHSMVSEILNRPQVVHRICSRLAWITGILHHIMERLHNYQIN